MKKTLLLLLVPLSLCASEFPTPYNSEPDKSKPMPAAEAAAKMQLPPGFKATVVAAEPDVQQPIATAWGLGRMAGCTAAVAHQARVRWVCRARHRSSGFRCAARCGVTTRRAKW